MASPFPGMDPWLEDPDVWPGLHNELIAALKFRLAPLLRPHYLVKLQERTYITEPEELVIIPDLTIHQHKSQRARAKGPGTAVVETKAVTVRVPIPYPVREWYIEVHKVGAGKLVTVVELLSPTNKREGEGRRLYLKKRNRIFESSTNLVEVDLVRSGKPMPMDGEVPKSHYRIVVSRGNRRPHAELWPFSVRDPIPRFALPLRPGDREPEVDLRAVLDQVYEAGS